MIPNVIVGGSAPGERMLRTISYPAKKMNIAIITEITFSILYNPYGNVGLFRVDNFRPPNIVREATESVAESIALAATAKLPEKYASTALIPVSTKLMSNA